jgi:hypothetical protein
MRHKMLEIYQNKKQHKKNQLDNKNNLKYFMRPKVLRRKTGTKHFLAALPILIQAPMSGKQPQAFSMMK